MAAEKTKVYTYTRVSTAMQIDGYSLDAQKARMKAYADFNDYQIVGEYEDAEESGLLVRLPCEVGDTVYHIKNLYKGKKITSRVIEQLCIDSFVIGDNGKPQANVCDNERNDWHYYDIVDFGRYVFLTREEAEKVLKERAGK